jgi:6-phosphogluconolactonase
MVSIFNNKEEIATHATNIFVTAAQNAIQKRGRFVVALTGGSSPVAIYKLWQPPYKAKIDWQNVLFFGVTNAGCLLMMPTTRKWHMIAF